MLQWIEYRRAISRRWQEDAKPLAELGPVNAYYEAQRSAARGRVQADAGECWHWAKVANKVARIELRAKIDFEVVKALAELDAAGRR